MFRHLSFVFKNSARNKRRSILTILSIAASLCILGLILALYHAFYLTEPAADSALRLWVRNRVSLANPLPVSYENRIRQVPGVKEVSITQWFGGVYKDERDPANFFGRFAVEPEKLRTVFTEYHLTEEQSRAFISERTACIVGNKLAARLKFKIGDRVTLVGDIFPVKLELTIRGIYESVKDNENLFFHWKYLNESLAKGRMDEVGAFAIRLENKDDAARVAQAVDDMFHNAPLQTKTETEQAFVLSFLAFLGNVKMFLMSISAAVTFTILLVSGNTMAMSVRERAREVGILKTLGYSPGTILSLILGESVVIALLGGVIGLGLAQAVCAVLRRMPSMFTDMSAIVLPAPLSGLCLLAAALIGLASSLIPAWGASRRSILDALRFTD